MSLTCNICDELSGDELSVRRIERRRIERRRIERDELSGDELIGHPDVVLIVDIVQVKSSTVGSKLNQVTTRIKMIWLI